uniref:60S ribosomal export protein NMD3 n=1 Tax=Globodera pallida TaxID=36090 RepID=A0A183BX19_GLOPA
MDDQLTITEAAIQREVNLTQQQKNVLMRMSVRNELETSLLKRCITANMYFSIKRYKDLSCRQTSGRKCEISQMGRKLHDGAVIDEILGTRDSTLGHALHYFFDANCRICKELQANKRARKCRFTRLLLLHGVVENNKQISFNCTCTAVSGGRAAINAVCKMGQLEQQVCLMGVNKPKGEHGFVTYVARYNQRTKVGVLNFDDYPIIENGYVFTLSPGESMNLSAGTDVATIPLQ